MKITGKIISTIAPNCKKPELVAAALDKICPTYGIDQPDIMHEFIARLCEECAEFNKFEENLRYSAPVLMKTWPKRFPTAQIAQHYAYNPIALANYVYGKRLGNTEPNDGWDMRGSGAMQLTGRGIITEFTIFFNKKFNTKYTPMEMAELLRKDIDIAIHGACWYFAVSRRLIPLALSDKLLEIVKLINGGTNGLAETKIYYDRAVQCIV